MCYCVRKEPFHEHKAATGSTAQQQIIPECDGAIDLPPPSFAHLPPILIDKSEKIVMGSIVRQYE